ncbi:MAG: hypothetical protein DMG68_01640 [Acidobacteria bacterium]|jgi:hypothetical protein|nr:MAG: hypothetical protein DMG68_01640 [Acidobacteriota bacterium]
MTVRRMKTYTGGQGYVYQYYFVGQRPALNAETPTTEYVFDVTADRKTMFSVSVLLDSNSIRGWQARHGRQLTDAEQYAAAKMRLFLAFDDIQDMKAQGRTLNLDPSVLEELLATLGVA